MIGSGLKKLAAENGMKVAQGVAYGNLGGFAATLSEGAGYKQIVFTTKLDDPQKKADFMASVDSVDLQKTYRVQNLGISPRSIQVIFQDNPGTMGKIRAFLDWFLPLLRQSGATPANICTECGFEITAGHWVLVDQGAYHFHDSCAQKVMREVQDDTTGGKRRTKVLTSKVPWAHWVEPFWARFFGPWCWRWGT